MPNPAVYKDGSFFLIVLDKGPHKLKFGFRTILLHRKLSNLAVQLGRTEEKIDFKMLTFLHVTLISISFRIYNDLKLNENGQPDAFLKKINHIDESKFGISVCTVDGQRFSIGDATTPFSLHSLSRPITYGIGRSKI